MSYLFQAILLTLANAIMLSPISFKLSLNPSIDLTASIPFLDVKILPTEKKIKKRRRKIGKRFNSLFRTIRALRRSLDVFLKRSTLTVFESYDDNDLKKSISYRGRSILFSLFLSYLASKTGIVITDENSLTNDEDNVFTLALIETRLYTVVYSTLVFVLIRYFPKKEQGIVR